MENIKNTEFLIILRSLGKGDENILVHPVSGKYASLQVKSFRGYEEYEEKPILSRLMFELYGEFPLSEHNKSDWEKNVIKAFLIQR